MSEPWLVLLDLILVSSFHLCMVDIHLLINHQLNISYLMITSNLWEESGDSESNILFLEGI